MSEKEITFTSGGHHDMEKQRKRAVAGATDLCPL